MQIIRAKLVTYSSTAHTCTVQPNAGPGALLDCDVVQNCPPGFLTANRDVAVLVYPDAKAVVLGPYGANADNWALNGILSSPYTPDTRVQELHPAGIRAAANNTFYDILQFTAESGISGKVATVSGLLTVTALVYATGGYYQMRSRLLFVSLRKMTTSAMQSTLQQIGTDNVLEYATKATTLTVQEKAGATATNLIIQARVTCTDYNTGSLFYTFIGGRGAMASTQVITATLLTD